MRSYQIYLSLVLISCMYFLWPSTSNAIHDIDHDGLSYVTSVFNTDQTWETLRSFASCRTDHTAPQGWMCSGAMLSASVVMTSAHCIHRGVGPDAGYMDKIVFRRYHNQIYNNYDDEEFYCPVTLYHSLQASDSDVMLLRCDPNASGELPGDKYGYIDTIVPYAISEGTTVYSYWSNEVRFDPLGYQDWNTVLYSWGTITDNTSTQWPPPSCETLTNHWALWSDLYSNGGCSGSIWIFPDYGYRTISAPTSTAIYEGYGRSSTLLRYVIYGNGTDLPWVEENIDQTLPEPVWCDPSLRINKMDEDLDGIFDAIEETDTNLTYRNVYSLNMDTSYRRNMWQWYTGPHSTTWVYEDTEPDPGYDALHIAAQVRPNAGATGWRGFIGRSISLTANKKYNVRAEFSKYDQQSPSKNDVYLGIYFWGAGCSYNNFVSIHYNYLTEPTDPKYLSFQIDTTNCTSMPTFYFYYYNDYGVTLKRFTVSRNDNGYWNFDNWDTREEWRKNNDTSHCLVTPDGYGQGWSGTAYGVVGSEWNENCMNRAIALLPNKNYRLKFYERRKSYNGNVSYVIIRSPTGFLNGENNVLYSQFTSTDGVWSLKTYDFHTNNYNDYYLSFGQKYNGSYYIDSVLITER